MSNKIIEKDKYIYLKTYGNITPDEVSDAIKQVEYIFSNTKLSNILVDIREHKEINISIYVFYEIIKKAPVMNTAFIINKKDDSIDLLSVLKILADVKLFKLKIFYEDKDVKKWIENL